MAAPFPFTALVGQEEMTLALTLAAVDQSLGGVLVFGDRGVGKSTAVRALAALLPPITAVEGCRFRCDPLTDPSQCAPGCPRDRKAQEPSAPAPGTVQTPTPVVDLPLGATEDRVVGALDLERALVHGEKRFEPGLLAQAHRGFLYIDEVNLLDDHLVDLLLDVAASGRNVVEREGLSLSHPARFVLIGSGNPEEGELRPQLLDRFGLSVEATTPSDLQERVEVVRRRDAFDRDPAAFHAAYAGAEDAARARIVAARDRLPDIDAPEETVAAAVRLCAALGSDGVRGELTLIRAARAAAALDGAATVDVSALRRVAPMALRHRLRRDPLDETGSSARVARAVDDILGGGLGDIPDGGAT